MSASNFVTSAKRKIRNGDVAYNRINSENVQAKIAASINSLIDSSFFPIDYNLQGYFAATSVFRGAPYRVHKTANIAYYQMSLVSAGSSGSTIINAQVRDETGAVVGNLFGSGSNRLLINAGSGTDIIIGRDLDAGTTFAINATLVSFQFGVLNFTTLNSGWSLTPFIEEAASRVRSMRFVLRMREQ